MTCYHKKLTFFRKCLNFSKRTFLQVMPNILQDLHKTPLLRVCVPFIVGILWAHEMPLYVGFLWLLVIVFTALVFMSYAFFQQYRNRYLFPILFTCVIVVSGALLFRVQKKNSIPDKLNQNGYFAGYVSSLPQQKKKSVFVEFTICRSDSTHLSKPIKTWIYIDKQVPDSSLLPGRWLAINANLKVPEKNPLPTEFDFYTYLAEQKVRYTAYVPLKNVSILNIKAKNNLKILSLSIKKKVLEIFVNNKIKGEELALVSALTIGYKKLIPREQREAYSASGAMHVLAVSGLHVGILFVLFSFLFGFLKQLPFGNLWFTLVVIMLMLLFAFITGFSPSVSRATIMFSFIAVGKLLRKQQYIINTIAASALVLLLIHPNALFKVGFQLSYIAVSGIVLFYPILSERWKASGRVTKWIIGLILVSVIAQIITAPMNAFYFHRFANYSVIANLIVIPLVTILLNLTILLVILGFMGMNFPLLGWLINAIAKAMNTSVYAISSLPGSTFESLYLTPIENLMLYSVLICILVFAYYKHKWTVWYLLSALLIFTGHKAFVKYNNRQIKQVLVYKDFGVPRILIKGRKEALVVLSESPESMLFCPVWFFKNGISEKNVYAVNYNQSIELDDFILYRQFVGFKNDVFKIVDIKAGHTDYYSLGESTTFNLNAKSDWHVKHPQLKLGNLNTDDANSTNLNLNKIGTYNTLVE